MSDVWSDLLDILEAVQKEDYNYPRAEVPTKVN